jgi:hypothetical protein
MSDENSRENAREQARDLVLAVWRRIDHESITPKRRKGIYDELASKIRSAALTSDLSRFVEGLARKFDVRALSDQKVLNIVKNGNHNLILDTLRNETTMIVLMLRFYKDGNRGEVTT